MLLPIKKNAKILYFNNNKKVIIFKNFKEITINNNKNINNNKLFIIQIII